LLDEIGQQETMSVEVEKRSVGHYTRKLLATFKERREVAFSEIFDKSEGRYGLIGTLIALLEMMKQGYLRGHQPDCFGEILLAYRGDDAVTADQILAGITADEEATRQQEEAAEAEASESQQAADTVDSAGFQAESDGFTAG
jgi:chromatin segregation and condensation protein Rec8/ScpA/Scc1 (kleisin family)